MKELLLGCGHRPIKEMGVKEPLAWENLTTVDCRANCSPDVVWDLDKHPLPFEDNEFDEIHAYHVLEHLGVMGDYVGFFNEFSDYHRILKKDGLLFGKVPANDLGLLFGEPSHKRVIVKENFNFLSQKAYKDQLGKTRLADYRDIYKADFDLICVEENDKELAFVLRAIK